MPSTPALRFVAHLREEGFDIEDPYYISHNGKDVVCEAKLTTHQMRSVVDRSQQRLEIKDVSFERIDSRRVEFYIYCSEK